MTIELEDYTIPNHISYSAMTTWLSCGWMYYLGRLLKLPEEESVWSTGGSAFHKAAEVYDLQEFSK